MFIHSPVIPFTTGIRMSLDRVTMSIIATEWLQFPEATSQKTTTTTTWAMEPTPVMKASPQAFQSSLTPWVTQTEQSASATPTSSGQSMFTMEPNPLFIKTSKNKQTSMKPDTAMASLFFNGIWLILKVIKADY